jgi:hypothetical protein
VGRLAWVIGIGVVAGPLVDPHLIAGQLLGEGLEVGEAARDLDALLLETDP